MKQPLKVGDRVRLIGFCNRGFYVDGKTGIIESINSEAKCGPIKFVPDGDSMLNFYILPSQCKRLKPKRKPREWWVNLYSDIGPIMHSDFITADQNASINRIDCVHVREVLGPEVKSNAFSRYNFYFNPFVKIPGKDFEICTAPVTQKEWQLVMRSNPSHFKGDEHPVENVSWDDVQSFIAKLNEQQSEYTYHLPTDEEWVYCCNAKGPAEIDNVEDYAWAHENSNGETHPVMTKKSNPWGLYDMLGNVWECIYDIHGPTRVLRGGSWDNGARSLRSA